MKPILFFDGICVLCNGFVDFAMRRDAHDRLRFASLQGKTAASTLAPEDRAEINFVVLVEGGTILRRSRAVLRVAYHLGGIWRVLAHVASWFPVGLADVVYSIIAGRRYRWFGRRAVCRVPSEAERGKMLD